MKVLIATQFTAFSFHFSRMLLVVVTKAPALQAQKLNEQKNCWLICLRESFEKKTKMFTIFMLLVCVAVGENLENYDHELSTIKLLYYRPL